MNKTPDNLPRRCVDQLMESDKLILGMLGIELLEVQEGEVTLAMQISKSMVNSQSFCHGGFVFALADSACAYAAASVNAAPATAEANISFVGPAKLGDTLTAVAQLENHGKKAIHATVRVTNQDGELIAIYRGSNVNRGQIIV